MLVLCLLQTGLIPTGKVTLSCVAMVTGHPAVRIRSNQEMWNMLAISQEVTGPETNPRNRLGGDIIQDMWAG